MAKTHRLSGVISNRLRNLFSPGDPAWTPQRPGSPTTPTPTPKGVKGRKLGGRK